MKLKMKLITETALSIVDDEGNPKSIDGERLSLYTSGSTIFKN